MSNTDTTTTEVTEETSTSVPQSEMDTNTTNDSQVTSDETTETTTNQQPVTLEALQAQVERITKALAKSNKDAKDHRLENNELKKVNNELLNFKKQVESEKLTEQEKRELERKNLEQQLADITRQRDDAITKNQQDRVKHSVQLQAAKLGMEQDVAEKLLDWAAIEYDDDGTPNNVSTLLSDLIKSKPYLVKTNGRQPVSSGGATNPPRSSTSSALLPDKLTWDVVDQLFANNAKGIQSLSQSDQKRVAQWMGLNARSRKH